MMFSDESRIHHFDVQNEIRYHLAGRIAFASLSFPALHRGRGSFEIASLLFGMVGYDLSS